MNTMLADLDEALRQLMTDALTEKGFDGVEISFEAPNKEWSAQLSVPTVNLFLYDLRESPEEHPMDWEGGEGANGRAAESRPPIRLDASFAVSAWTREVEDEHRLLSQVASVLFAYPSLPEEVLSGALVQSADKYPIAAALGEPRQDGGPEFWTSIGGSYKVSLDYRVTMSLYSGTVLERGPEVRTQTLRTRQIDGGSGTVEELHRLGGKITDKKSGDPLPNVWVVMKGGRGWTASDRDGRFIFSSVRAGTYELLARSSGGAETTVSAEVPGPPVDIAMK
jgi:hypothetical protein